MVILGINAFHADSSAAILVDGKLRAAIEEERFTRIKHWAGFPARSVAFCLKEAGVSLAEVDHITIGRNPKAKLLNKLFYLLRNPVLNSRAVLDRLVNSKKVAGIDEKISGLSNIGLGRFQGKIHAIEHHRSHLASAFFASPFQEAALLSLDGSGDFTTTMMGFGSGNRIKVLDSIDFPHSLGIFYTAMTQWLGFPHYGDEYKVMGLAPYGKPVHRNQLFKLLQLKKNGKFQLDLRYFRKPGEGIVSYEDNIPLVQELFNGHLIALLGPARKPEEPLSQYHKDIAASVQQVTEEVIFHILNHLHKVTSCDNLCLAGGIAQNSVANGKITRNTPFRQVYIPSAGHDAGISMGSAYYAYNHVLGNPRAEPVFSAYTGSHFTSNEIAELLRSKGVSFRLLSDEELFSTVADCLIDSGVVGWFSGRSEFGPRALGARSILADPRRPDAKDLINSKIKRRESFRPFAPSILKEHVSEYFELGDPVPFMEKVYPVRNEKQKIIPAVTHVDGTGRLQSVDPVISSRYYRLIHNFYQKTGVPILLNTSFNENEPIVNTPEEALNCFLRTRMDMLVMENVLVERRKESSQS